MHAAHVAEMARRMVVERYGTEAYSSGIRVTTSLSAADQRAAYAAVQRGVLAFDRRGAWRGPEGFEELPVQAANGAELTSLAAEALKDHRDDDTLRVAIVLSASPKEVQVQLASGDRVTLKGNGLRWAQAGLKAKVKQELKLTRGSVVRVVQSGKKGSPNEWDITPMARSRSRAGVHGQPTPAACVRWWVVSIHARQPFNHVTQAWRQPGSSFKPLLYSAALEARVMPGTLIDDLPFTASNGWSPSNSHGRRQPHHAARSAGPVQQPRQRARAEPRRRRKGPRLDHPLRPGPRAPAQRPHARAGHRQRHAAADGAGLRHGGQRRLEGGAGGGGKDHRCPRQGAV